MLLRFLLYWLKRADREEIDKILDVAVERRKALFPNWDMMYIGLPKDDPEERRRIVEHMLRCIDQSL